MLKIVEEVFVPLTLPLKKGGFVKVFAILQNTDSPIVLVHPGEEERLVDRGEILPLALEFLDSLIKNTIASVYAHHYSSTYTTTTTTNDLKSITIPPFETRIWNSEAT